MGPLRWAGVFLLRGVNFCGDCGYMCVHLTEFFNFICSLHNNMHRACGSTENAVEVWGLDTYCYYYYLKIIKKDINVYIWFPA